MDELSGSESLVWRLVWRKARRGWGLVQAWNDRASLRQGTEEGQRTELGSCVGILGERPGWPSEILRAQNTDHLSQPPSLPDPVPFPVPMALALSRKERPAGPT